MLEATQNRLFQLLNTGIEESWNWFNGLTREEWIVVMAAGCALGYLLLMGLTKKHRV